MNYVKHEIKCNCILPQHRALTNPPNYSFIVLSVLDERDRVIEKLAACDNCGRAHRVYEIGKSEVIMSETSRFITKEDISKLLPEKVSSILNDFECLLYQYEEAKIILDNALWGKFIILSRDKNNDSIKYEGKLLRFVGYNNYSIDYWQSDY